MFTEDEVKLIRLKYFKQKHILSDICEIESRNGDHWIIMKRQRYVSKKQLKYTKAFSYVFEIYHRHANAEGFHYHSESESILKAIFQIIDHDYFRLKS